MLQARHYGRVGTSGTVGSSVLTPFAPYKAGALGEARTSTEALTAGAEEALVAPLWGSTASTGKPLVGSGFTLKGPRTPHAAQSGVMTHKMKIVL